MGEKARDITRFIVPLLIGLGIAATFMREVLIAYLYGSSRVVESYRIAFAMPYALFQSLGAVLVGSVLPLCIKGCIGKIRSIQRQIYIFFGVIFVFAIFTVPWQARVLAPGFDLENMSLLEKDMYLCWLILIFSALMFPIRLLLQSVNKITLVSSTSLLYSVVFMGLLAAPLILPGNMKSGLISASIFSVFIVYLFFAIAYLKQIKPIKALEVTKHEKVNIYGILLSGLIYVFMLTVPRLIDRAIASGYVEGVVANIDYAMNFYVAFGVLLGTSYIIIMTQKIAFAYVENNRSWRWYIKLISYPFMASVVLSLFVALNADELVSLAYARGKFTGESSIQTSELLIWFMLPFPFTVAGMVMAQILMAGNMMALTLISLVKISAKGLAIIFLGIGELSVFGLSTLVMEIIGASIMLVYIFWSKGFIRLSMWR